MILTLSWIWSIYLNSKSDLEYKFEHQRSNSSGVYNHNQSRVNSLPIWTLNPTLSQTSMYKPTWALNPTFSPTSKYKSILFKIVSPG
jgi:hypothetical protein